MTTTSTRVEDADIAGLLERVEKATGADRELDCTLHNAMFGTEYIRSVGSVSGFFTSSSDNGCPYVDRYTSSIDDALALVERMLPGWMWRVASCSVSDDAWVCPDFNHPGYGAALQAEFNEAFGGRDPAEAIIEATDVDRRPAGKPALALIQSLLLALILLRSLSQGAGHEQ